MKQMSYYAATENDIAFIAQTYEENIKSLHGNYRNYDDWQGLLSDENSMYYMVRESKPVAWFRVDIEDSELWLGMLQVRPAYHRQVTPYRKLGRVLRLTVRKELVIHLKKMIFPRINRRGKRNV